MSRGSCTSAWDVFKLIVRRFIILHAINPMVFKFLCPIQCILIRPIPVHAIPVKASSLSSFRHTSLSSFRHTSPSLLDPP
jgi:hypothetical protein